MEQNQIILIAVVALVVIGVIAFVVMNNNGGGDAVPNTSGGTPTVPSGGGSPIVPPVAGGSIICDISITGTQDGVESSMSGTTKLKSPDKMKMDMTASGEGISMDIIMIVNGETTYMYTPMFGGWLETPTSEVEGYDADMLANLDSLSAAEIEAMMADTSAIDPTLIGDFTPTVSCRAASIPDSEFQLPAGAQLIDLEELYGDMGTTTY